MTSRDPIGRWGPYEDQRRRARARGIAAGLLVLTVVGLALAASKLAFLGLAVAP